MSALIRSITLQGFKSFADRTHLEFGDGVCAVIGPNGSGKSNVVEAIRWATHGARARELRAGRGTELIFHGSGGKAPLGLAEVQLELHGSEGRLNLTRRVYRDGTAEQDLNGKGVRARDVQMALRGTGLGPGGLAVIGQGEVSGVVQAEGKTLLGYLQEAAGLSRAVNARQETEARLHEADLHLNQLRLVLEERVMVVDRLAKAAVQARFQRELTQRVLVLEEALRRERQSALHREIRTAQAEVRAAERRSQELSEQVQRASAELDAAREGAQEAKARREAYTGALETLTAAREAHAQAQRYQHHLQNEARTLQAELDALPLQLPLEAAPDLGGLQAQASAQRSAAETAERLLRQLDAELTRERAHQAQRAEASARASASTATLQNELERAEAHLGEARARLQAAMVELATAQQAREAQEDIFAAINAQRVSQQAHQRHLLAELTRLQASEAPLRRERERLEQTLNSYARYGEGARNALRLNHSGIVGSLADLLTVPGELELAVNAALGRRLEQVVVHSADDAREIIEELKRLGGRATFLPLDVLRPRPRRDGSLLREPGVLGNLADLCPTDPHLVGEAVLSDTVIVQDLRIANRLARTHSARPRLVTLGGEVVEPGGAITGGRLRDTGSALLGDQRRFQELDTELADLEQGAQRLREDLSRVESALHTSAAEHDRLLASREAASNVEREAERRVTGLEAQVRGFSVTCERLLAQLAGPAEPGPTPDPVPDLTELERELLLAREAAETARALEREHVEALALARELDSAWEAYRQAINRAEQLQARLDSNQLSSAAQQTQLDAAAAEVARREAALGTLDETEYSRMEAAREQAALRYSNLIAEQNKVRMRLDELQLLIARREGSLEEIPAGCSPAGTPKEWNAELSKARTAIEELGPVNSRAEADHALESELLASQQAEVDDAATASAELRVHLTELDTLEAQATLAAYGRVNAAFREYSEELLGGSGELETELNETGRLTGLRLTVQPKGKRTRSMALLSAGERTMAGLAFLFALNHAGGEQGMGGLPLAVLDEVDAPLDEANIRRFTMFLQRFSERGTQFLLVTHQKATMEVATALWGVTTDQTGASRVLSIKQPEDAANA